MKPNKEKGKITRGQEQRQDEREVEKEWKVEGKYFNRKKGSGNGLEGR